VINEIGESAGRVWQYLSQHSPATPGETCKTLKLDEVMLYMAVGWLAREDMLAFTGEGKSLKISLLEQ
jgi:hypothetical protein